MTDHANADRGLTQTERSVLNELAWSDRAWNRPLDLGGRDGSYHSGTLSRLVKKGLAEKRDRHGWERARGSYVYRITEAGKQAIK